MKSKLEIISLIFIQKKLTKLRDVNHWIFRKTNFHYKKINVSDRYWAKRLHSILKKRFAKHTKLLVTLEENTTLGGFGSAVLEILSEYNLSPLTLTLGVEDRFIAQANPDQQREDVGLSAGLIFESILRKCELFAKRSKKAS